jgi:hypothetical protein
MTNAAIAPLARFPCTSSIAFPAMTAEGITLASSSFQTYMPYPDGQADIIWQGNEFGLSAPAGSNVTYAAVTVTHRISNVSAYSNITAQLWAGGVPVGNPVAFTPSITYVTETVSTRSGFPPANVSTLAVRLTYHQIAMGLVYIGQASAEVAYSFASSIGIVAVAGSTAIVAPVISVTLLPVSLVSQGTAGQNLSPVFGQPTAAGSLLLAWVFSNSSSPTLDTICNTSGWSLLNVSGSALAWLTLWAKPVSISNEIPPTFSTGATIPMSQLLEFSGANSFDQTGVGIATNPTIVISTNSGIDSLSGDLIFGICTWLGTNLTPQAISMTGNDGSGAPLALHTASNAAISNQMPWITGWAQAGGAVGPAGDQVTGTLGIFDSGQGIIASFRTTLPQESPALELSGFGPFNINPGHTIISVSAVITQHTSNVNTSLSYQLWDNSNAQIGSTQAGTASLSAGHTDTVTFSGVVYSQVHTLVLRIYASQGTAPTSAVQYVDAASLSILYV